MSTIAVTALLCGVPIAFMALAARILVRSLHVEGALAAADRWIALFFLAVGGEIIGYMVTAQEPGLRIGIAVAISSCSLLAFVRTVFRPVQGWALGLAWVLGLSISAVFIVPHFAGGPTPEIRIAWSLLRSSALLWAFCECTLYYRRMKRQLAIGLGDPVVANRFLLWACWTAGTAMLPLSGLGLRLLARAGLVEDYTTTRTADLGAIVYATVIGTSLLVAAVSLWLSFTPPAGYRRWLLQSVASDESRA